MFKFLKDKLKSAVKSFSKGVDEEIKEEKIEEKVIEKEEIKQKKIKIKHKEQPEQEHLFEPSEELEKEAKYEDEHISEVLDKEIEQVKEIENELEEEEKEIEHEEKKPGFLRNIFSKKKAEEEEEEEKKEKEKEEQEEQEKKEKEEEEEKQEEEKKKGLFGKFKETISTKSLSEEKFDELYQEIEMALLESNVAVSVIEKMKEKLKEELVDKRIKRSEIEDIVINTFKKTIEELFDKPGIDIVSRIKQKNELHKPYVIAFFGVNGSGKTTNLAKLAYLLEKQGLKCVIAACDTFRAAAIQQIEEHTNKLGIKLIKYDYGADPAAVAFDAVKYAEQKGLNVVLIDTAGRMHSNTNLMEELRKIVRVSKPDLKIFVGESITGNDCVEQAKTYDEMVGIDAIILTKIDVDEKGGAAVSVSHITGKPIIYVGTGQGYDDLKEFDKNIILENLGL